MIRLSRIGVVLAGGVLSGLLGNAVHSAGVPLGQPVWSLAEVGQCTAAGEHGGKAAAPLTALDWIDPQDAMALRGQPGVFVGDLRTGQQYAEGHIAGAIHLPCAGKLGQEALGKIPPSARLLLYDADGRSPQLSTAAATAALRGGRGAYVYVLKGGFAAWLLSGLPAESGTCESCGGH